MTSARAKYLQGYCKEQKIRMNEAIRNGKMIPDLGSIETIYGILEEILSHIEVHKAPKL